MVEAELLLKKEISILDYYNDVLVTHVKYNIYDKRVQFRKMTGHTGICPFHEDSDLSFSFWKEKGLYYCFGCRTSGDVITFHQKVQQIYYGTYLNREQAIQALALLYKINLPKEALETKQNVFSKARTLLNTNQPSIPKNIFTLAEYTTLNNKTIRSQSNPVSKIEAYDQLDLMACVYISGQVQVEEKDNK